MVTATDEMADVATALKRTRSSSSSTHQTILTRSSKLSERWDRSFGEDLFQDDSFTFSVFFKMLLYHVFFPWSLPLIPLIDSYALAHNAFLVPSGWRSVPSWIRESLPHASLLPTAGALLFFADKLPRSAIMLWVWVVVHVLRLLQVAVKYGYESRVHWERTRTERNPKLVWDILIGAQVVPDVPGLVAGILSGAMHAKLDLLGPESVVVLHRREKMQLARILELDHPDTPDRVKGWFNFHDSAVPNVTLALLVLLKACREHSGGAGGGARVPQVLAFCMAVFALYGAVAAGFVETAAEWVTALLAVGIIVEEGFVPFIFAKVAILNTLRQLYAIRTVDGLIKPRHRLLSQHDQEHTDTAVPRLRDYPPLLTLARGNNARAWLNLRMTVKHWNRNYKTRLEFAAAMDLLVVIFGGIACVFARLTGTAATTLETLGYPLVFFFLVTLYLLVALVTAGTNANKEVRHVMNDISLKQLTLAETVGAARLKSMPVRESRAKGAVMHARLETSLRHLPTRRGSGGAHPEGREFVHDGGAGGSGAADGGRTGGGGASAKGTDDDDGDTLDASAEFASVGQGQSLEFIKGDLDTLSRVLIADDKEDPVRVFGIRASPAIATSMLTVATAIVVAAGRQLLPPLLAKLEQLALEAEGITTNITST